MSNEKAAPGGDVAASGAHSGQPEPRWPAMVALIAVGVVRFEIPNALTEGPNWLLIIVVCVLLIPTVWTHWRGWKDVNRIFGYVLTAVVTADMVWSLCLLVAALPSHQMAPQYLLRAASALWISNILIFASWYWRLDAGGPNARDDRAGHMHGAFLFPQMTLSLETRKAMRTGSWSPGFVDYLFLAFNTSTAFSPTDVPVLTRWAKILMMLQSLISLATIVLLAARAVNIL
jgi:hypothetical protein